MLKINYIKVIKISKLNNIKTHAPQGYQKLLNYDEHIYSNFMEFEDLKKSNLIEITSVLLSHIF